MLKEILPRLTNVDEWEAAFAKYMPKYGIDTVNEKRFSLSNILHESMGLTHLEENLNYSSDALMKTWPTRFKNKIIADQYARKPERIANFVYASRLGNGNEGSGDGWKYRGRGAIQLTGKDNYSAAGKAIYGLPEKFVNEPDLLTTIDTAAQVACWFWQSHGLNEIAQTGDFEACVKRINGGLNGLASRKEWLRELSAIIK